MKKALALILTLVCLCGAVLAEAPDTREVQVRLEGKEVTAVETRYDTGFGFSFWYPADLLSVDRDFSESGMSLLLCPAEMEIDLPIYMELMLPEAIGLNPGEFLDENAPEGLEYSVDIAENGQEIVFYSLYDAETGLVSGSYVVRKDIDHVVLVATVYPATATAGFAGWFNRIIWNIEID